MDFSRNTPEKDYFGPTFDSNFDSDWNQSREQARKRFDEKVDSVRRKMFDNTQWANMTMPSFGDRPFPTMVSNHFCYHPQVDKIP